MKVWITKYALTTGISEIDAEICTDISTDMIKEVRKDLNNYSAYYHGNGRQWHETLEGAKAKAEEMRVKQIKTLEKKIAKLEKMKF
jgi:hypothetical protein